MTLINLLQFIAEFENNVQDKVIYNERETITGTLLVHTVKFFNLYVFCCSQHMKER